MSNKITESQEMYIDPTTTHVGKSTADEVKKLEEAVRAHGAKNRGVIAALVPGRPNRKCCDRWTNYVDPNLSSLSSR
jgi:hypothetical protein